MRRKVVAGVGASCSSPQALTIPKNLCQIIRNFITFEKLNKKYLITSRQSRLNLPVKTKSWWHFSSKNSTSSIALLSVTHISLMLVSEINGFLFSIVALE